MQIIKYNPFRELQKMQSDLDKFWDVDWDISPAMPDWSTMDMYEEGGNLITEFSLPNFKKNEVHVKTENGVLEVMAEHVEKEEDKKKRRYYRRESSNRFWRRVALPEGANENKSEAEFKNGTLTIKMPLEKNKKEIAKEITIK